MVPVEFSNTRFRMSWHRARIMGMSCSALTSARVCVLLVVLCGCGSSRSGERVLMFGFSEETEENVECELFGGNIVVRTSPMNSMNDVTSTYSGTYDPETGNGMVRLTGASHPKDIPVTVEWDGSTHARLYQLRRSPVNLTRVK